MRFLASSSGQRLLPLDRAGERTGDRDLDTGILAGRRGSVEMRAEAGPVRSRIGRRVGQHLRRGVVGSLELTGRLGVLHRRDFRAGLERGGQFHGVGVTGARAGEQESGGRGQGETGRCDRHGVQLSIKRARRAPSCTSADQVMDQGSTPSSIRRPSISRPGRRNAPARVAA